MKVSCTLVISVIMKVHTRVIFADIFRMFMKVTSFLVVSVIIKPREWILFRNIFSQNMR